MVAWTCADTFVDVQHPVVVDLVARRAAGDPEAEEMLPYESDERLLDGRWHKIPNEIFRSQMMALEAVVEEVEPSRQELVSYGVDMGVYLESYFKQVRTGEDRTGEDRTGQDRRTQLLASFTTTCTALHCTALQATILIAAFDNAPVGNYILRCERRWRRRPGCCRRRRWPRWRPS